jgi:AcrR family transcriptional regulator
MSVNMQARTERRPYRQGKRSEMAAETRRRLIAAAKVQLTRRPLRRISLEAIAAAAGVSRPTVYAVFGSRGGLFDAVAETTFMSTGMADIAAAFELPDPIEVMETSFPIGSRMYAKGRPVWHALLAMSAIDRAASDAMLRTEKRRAAGMRDLAARLDAAGLLGAGVDRDAAFAQLWVVTSFAVFDLLTGAGLGPDEVTRWVFRTTKQTLQLERLGAED